MAIDKGQAYGHKTLNNPNREFREVADEGVLYCKTLTVDPGLINWLVRFQREQQSEISLAP